MTTLKALALLSFFAAVAFAQTPAQPWPNHAKPTEGWFCHPASTTKEVQTNAHACECRGMTFEGDIDPAPHCKVQGVDEDGNPAVDDKGQPIMVDRGESAKCKAFCHAQHCHCAKRCKTT